MNAPLLIQRPPSGLLDLLGLKAMGQGPIQLTETVTCTLADCVDYYVANRRVTLAGNTSIAMTATGQFAVPSLTVPAGEMWLVYAFGCQLAGPAAAATDIVFWGGFTRSATVTTMVPITSSIKAGAGDNQCNTVVFTRPFVLLPGDAGAVRTGAVTGVPGQPGQIVLDVARLTL